MYTPSSLFFIRTSILCCAVFVLFSVFVGQAAAQTTDSDTLREDSAVQVPTPAREQGVNERSNAEGDSGDRVERRIETRLQQTNSGGDVDAETRANLGDRAETRSENRADMREGEARTQNARPFEEIRERARQFITGENEADTGVRAEIRERIEQEKEEIAERRAERAAAIAEKRAELQRRIEERKAEIEGRIAEQRADVSEQVRERIQVQIDRMLERFNAALSRLTQIADRVETRITELEANGLETADAREQLTLARDRITEAGDNIDAIAAEITIVITDPTEIGAAFADVRVFLTNAKNELQAARDTLVEAVRLIREADDDTPNADTAQTRCEAQLAAAEQAADGQICTQQIARMSCPLADDFVAEARNGCVISTLESRGWEPAGLPENTNTE